MPWAAAHSRTAAGLGPVRGTGLFPAALAYLDDTQWDTIHRPELMNGPEHPHPTLTRTAAAGVAKQGGFGRQPAQSACCHLGGPQVRAEDLVPDMRRRHTLVQQR